MKKLIALLLALCLFVTLGLSLVSCGDGDDGDTTGDNTADGGQNGGGNNNGGNNNGGTGDGIGDTPANGGGTTELNCQNGGGHVYGTPEITHTATHITTKHVCGVCGHEESSTVAVETVVGGEEGWNNAFEAVTFENYTLTVNLGGGHTNTVIVTEDALYYQAFDNILYTVKQADGTWTNYMSEYGGPWIVDTGCDDGAYLSAKRMATLSISYANFFSRFTYDATSGTYVCQDPVTVICYDGGGTELMYCFNNVVKVANGNVIYIDCSYSFESDLSDSMHFIYDNIGISTVSVPYSVMANATPGTVGNPFGGGEVEDGNDATPEENAEAREYFYTKFGGAWYSEDDEQGIVIGETTFSFTYGDGSYLTYEYYVNYSTVQARATSDYYFTEAMRNQLQSELGMSIDEYIELVASMGFMDIPYGSSGNVFTFGGVNYERVS